MKIQPSLLLAVLALAVGFVGWGIPSPSPQVNTSLGVWNNMPAASTELMGNTTYRGLLASRASGGESGLSVGLTVGCVTPSNTLGAILQLQYANYSDTTHLNTTNFVNIGSGIPIDNSANWPCPGQLEANSGSLPSIASNPTIFEFRVLGSNGGGTGDNPRFGSVSVSAYQLSRRTPLVIVGTPSTTTFTFQTQEVWPLVSATSVSIQWMATNITTTACGFISDHCWESGTSSATINAGATASASTTVTFSTAFTGTVHVTATGVGAGTVVTLTLGTISLLQAQTLTV